MDSWALPKCKAVKDDPAFYEACIFDYCVSGGGTDGDELVKNAIDTDKTEKA